MRRRIFLTRVFLVGAVVALVGGAALAAVTSSTGSRTNDAPFTVPIGRLGDRAVYAFHASGGDAEVDWALRGPLGLGTLLFSGQASPSPASLAPLGARVFEVSAPVSAFDATHVRHDAILVAENHTLPKDPSYRYTVVEHVDLDVRTVFRLDENVAAPSFDRRDVDLGSSGRLQSSSFAVRPSTLPGLALQGQTLHLGLVLRDGPVEVPSHHAAFAQQAHEKQWVVARQKIDGVDSYAVRTELTYKAVPGQVSATTVGHKLDAPAALSVRAWIVDWMSADYAYAVLREAGMEVMGPDGAEPVGSHQIAYHLKRVEGGTAFIPWTDHEAPHWSATRTDLERSPASQVHPADGSGSSLRYPLSVAIQNAENDLTLLTYRAWKQTHPNAFVVGARHTVVSGPTSLPSATWVVLFATTNGEGFAVSSAKDLQTDAVTNTAIGTRSVPSFSTADLLSAPPTIAAVEKTWTDYVSDAARSRGFNYVRWGLDPGGPKAGCASDPTYMLGLKGLDFFRYAEGGHAAVSAEPSCAIRSTGGSVLFLDATTGRVDHVQESEFRHGVAESPTDDSFRSGWSRAASTVPSGVRPPSPSQTATGSFGLLLLFVTAYFWPTLKFVGAKAILVASYAKIAKDDVLNNPVREQILQLIRTVPGIHASDIGRQVNVGWGTVVYHLSVLERNKIVTSLVDGRHKRFFPADSVDYSKRGQLAALMNANTRTIYEMIENTPGIIQGDLANRAALTVPTIIWHLQRLEEAGLVGRDKQGRTFHYFANPVYQPKKAEPGDAMEVQ